MNDEHKYSAGATIKDKDFFFFFFPLFFTTHTILFIEALCTSLKIFCWPCFLCPECYKVSGQTPAPLSIQSEHCKRISLVLALAGVILRPESQT